MLMPLMAFAAVASAVVEAGNGTMMFPAAVPTVVTVIVTAQCIVFPIFLYRPAAETVVKVPELAVMVGV
jgi:hypothetical protein